MPGGSPAEHLVDDRFLFFGSSHDFFDSELAEDWEDEFAPSVAAVSALAAVVVGVDDHPGSSLVEFVSFLTYQVGEDGCAFNRPALE